MLEVTEAISAKLKSMKISIWVLLGYSSGFFGYGFITQMMTSYLVFYATVVLKISGGLVGLIVSISVVWDAVSDPVMGYISDMTVTKYGRRHIYIVIGTVGIAVTNLLLWNVDIEMTTSNKFLWLVVSVLLIKTFVTVFVTPYSALGAELSDDYNERSKIQGTKTIFYLMAFIVVGAVCMFVYFKPTDVYPVGQMNPEAYRNISLTASFVMLITGYMTYKSTKYLIPELEMKQVKTRKVSLKEFLKTINYCMSLDNYRHIFFGFLYTNIASAVITVVGLHTFTYTFQMSNYEIGVVLGLQFLVCILAQPYWVNMASKGSKKRAVSLGLKVSMIGCLVLFGLTLNKALVVEHYEYLLLYSVVIGFGTSGLFSLPLSMVADTVDEQEFYTNDRNEGVYYGMLNFGYKISQSVAILILGILLDVIHFDASLTTQMNETTTLLGVILSSASMLAFIMAAIAYKGYSASEERVAFIQAEIKNRKSGK